MIWGMSLLVWLLLVATLDQQELLAGLIVSIIVATISYPRLAILDGLKISLWLPFQLLNFLKVFLKALVLANLDLAKRVLTPSLPLQPAVVEVQTSLKSDLGKLLLANCITLTPGTLTLDVVDDHLLVHWIDSHSHEDLDYATRMIVSEFETQLVKFLW